MSQTDTVPTRSHGTFLIIVFTHHHHARAHIAYALRTITRTHAYAYTQSMAEAVLCNSTYQAPWDLFYHCFHSSLRARAHCIARNWARCPAARIPASAIKGVPLCAYQSWHNGQNVGQKKAFAWLMAKTFVRQPCSLCCCCCCKERWPLRPPSIADRLL